VLALVLICAGVLLMLCCCCILLACFRRRKKKEKADRDVLIISKARIVAVEMAENEAVIDPNDAGSRPFLTPISAAAIV